MTYRPSTARRPEAGPAFLRHVPRLLRTPMALALLLLLTLVAGPQAAQAADLGTLRADLDELESRIKSKKSINEDILQYLDAVASQLRGIQIEEPPAAPEPLADDATDEQKEAHAAAEQAHKEAMSEYDKRMSGFQKDYDKMRKEVFKQFFKALTLSRVENDTNQRDRVNIQAALLIGELGALQGEKERKDLSKDVIKAIGDLHKVKDYQLNSEHLNATFAALGKLGMEDSLKWLAENYIHTKDNERQFLIAAHKAMILFTAVPGSLRFMICEEMIKTYSSVESQAEQSSNDPAIQAKKRFWDAIRTETIPCVQYFAGQPKKAEDGAALAKMAEFQDWFRDHKHPRKPPWVDDEPK